MEKKLLSVVMPNYNDSATLAEAIDAMLRQSLKPNEFIIIDDASTDSSSAIIQRYADRHPIIKFLKNSINIGVVASNNRGVKNASGEYLYLASANDKILPGFFEKSMRHLLDHAQAAVSCTDFYFQYPDLTLVREPKEPFARKPEYLSPGTLISRMRRRRFYVPHGCGVIYKRSSLIKGGRYLAELGSAADWFAIHVTAFREGICYVPEALAVNRLMPDSFSAKHARRLGLQKKIYSFGRSLVQTPGYRDVSAAFQQSGAILAFFGKSRFEQLQTLVLHPKYWRYLVPLFAHRVLIKMKEIWGRKAR